MLILGPLVRVIASALLVSAATPTKTVTKRASGSSDAVTPFVTTSQDGQFMFNGSALNFVGTNAYWLSTLNSDDDIDFTLGNMSAAGIKVVRTWGFNDVETIPENGTWFQLIANGTTTVNEGPNGLQKLDTVIRMAEKHGIFLHLSLTNNWNPRPLLENNATGITIEGRDVTPGTNNTLPRNTLSNDYGGMDVYVRQFGSGNLSTHDEFYTNPDIQTKFMNYTTQIVSRYKNSSAIFAWEIANDPRCNSSMSASPNCNTNVITMFHANVSKHIQSVDPNHLVASGNQGFLCMDCKKLFPRQPPPQPSAKPVGRRSTIAKPLTKRKLLDDRKAAFKKTRALAQKTKPATTTGGVRIRGRWMSTETKRQSSDTQDVGPAFDGSSGVDSEDIINIPSIGFGSFQLFPDQNSYGLDDPNLPAFNNTVNQGLAWIQTHAALGALFNKPVILNGFGLVTQNNSQAFVPFNSSEAPFAQDTGATQAPFGVTDQQRDDAYTQWLQAGLAAGLQGMLQYQWSQGNLTTAVGTAISPTSDGTGVSSDVTGTGVSPDDGYGIQGSDFNGAAGIIQTAAQAFGLDDPNP